MCGPSGVGKSTAGRILVEITQARLICAHDLRQEAARTLEAALGLHSPPVNARTYALMMAEARRQLSTTDTGDIVLDGTFLTRKLRLLARGLADDCAARLVAVVLDAEPRIVDSRLLLRRDRHSGPTSLRLQIAEDHRQRFERPLQGEADVTWHLHNDGTISQLERSLRFLTDALSGL